TVRYLSVRVAGSGTSYPVKRRIAVSRATAGCPTRSDWAGRAVGRSGAEGEGRGEDDRRRESGHRSGRLSAPLVGDSLIGEAGPPGAVLRCPAAGAGQSVAGAARPVGPGPVGNGGGRRGAQGPGEHR